jgi:S-adenosylmethionine decarboxylase
VRIRREKIRLRGFNNLTKSLSFNIYDICYAKSRADRNEYLAYIDEMYNSERLESILKGVTKIIRARILNVSTQDYDPMGASVAILIAEGSMEHEAKSDISLAHLDKSHLCAHTYPETDKASGISTFRVDIDISTCGKISPLTSLNYLIKSFDSEVVLLDYRVRGFTRNVQGKKLFIDHDIHSIQQFIPEDVKKRYDMVDINISQENLFHTKMVLKDFLLDNYLFGTTAMKLNRLERQKVKDSLKREMTEIFYAKNLFR